MASSMRSAAAAKAMETSPKSGGNKTFNNPSSDTKWKGSDPTKHVTGVARPSPADSLGKGRPFGLARTNAASTAKAPAAPPKVGKGSEKPPVSDGNKLQNKPGGAPAGVAPTGVKAPPPRSGQGDSADAKTALAGNPPEAKPAYIGQNIGGNSWQRAKQSARGKIVTSR